MRNNEGIFQRCLLRTQQVVRSTVNLLRGLLSAEFKRQLAKSSLRLVEVTACHPEKFQSSRPRGCQAIAS